MSEKFMNDRDILNLFLMARIRSNNKTNIFDHFSKPIHYPPFYNPNWMTGLPRWKLKISKYYPFNNLITIPLQSNLGSSFSLFLSITVRLLLHFIPDRFLKSSSYYVLSFKLILRFQFFRISELCECWSECIVFYQS